MILRLLLLYSHRYYKKRTVTIILFLKKIDFICESIYALNAFVKFKIMSALKALCNFGLFNVIIATSACFSCALTSTSVARRAELEKAAEKRRAVAVRLNIFIECKE